MTESGDSNSCNKSDQKCGGTTLIAACLGGAKRYASARNPVDKSRGFLRGGACCFVLFFPIFVEMILYNLGHPFLGDPGGLSDLFFGTRAA